MKKFTLLFSLISLLALGILITQTTDKQLYILLKGNCDVSNYSIFEKHQILLSSATDFEPLEVFFKITIIILTMVAWYKIKKFIYRTTHIQCPNCKKWIKKVGPTKELISTKTIRRSKKYKEYIRIDGGEQHEIEHEHFVEDDISNYRYYYNCNKCEKTFDVDNHGDLIANNQ